ncbi:MAG: TolC family protein [Arenicellales bacterium]
MLIISIAHTLKLCLLISVLLLSAITPGYAATDENNNSSKLLPETLTLTDALSIAELHGSPERDIAEAEILESSAELASVESRYGFRVKAEAFPRYVYAIDSSKGEDINDSFYALSTNKILSDFGRTEKLSQAAEADVRADAIRFVSFRYRRRLLIIQAYLNVLLADQRYAVENEKMTISYLRYDKIRERHGLGEISDVDLLAKESAYREELLTRMRSANRQSEARAELGALLNRPDDFPAELQPIVARGDKVELEEYQGLLSKALTQNPELSAQDERVKAARARLEHSQMSRRPVLDSLVELGNYKRRYGDGGKWRVGVNLVIPIREGGRFKAEIAKKRAELQKEEARYHLMKNALRKTILELVQELEVLKAAVKSANVRLEYRDMSLDRSRSAYELEIQTNLGDAAANMTDAQWNADKVKYDLLLTLGNLDALLGIDPAKRFLELVK